MTTTAKFVTNQIACVRTVVANYSNDEILLVLEHNDYDVNVTISDFLEGKANDILTEWQHTGPMKTNKAKKKKKVQKKKESESTISKIQDQSSNESNLTTSDANKNDKLDNNVSLVGGMHEHKENNSETIAISLKQLLVSEPASHTAVNDNQSSFLLSQSSCGDQTKTSNSNDVTNLNLTQNRCNKTTDTDTKPVLQYSSDEKILKAKWSSKKQKRNNRSYKSDHHDSRTDQASRSHFHNIDRRNTGSIEKASRDLRSCTDSFSRHRSRLNQEIDESYKRIKQVFEEVTSALIDREVQLMRMLDVRKEDVFRLLSRREKRANELRRSTESASEMTQQQVEDLLLDINDFIADHKANEDLARSNQFVFDRKLLEKFIPNFGAISSVKSSASAQSICESTVSDLSTATSSLVDTPPDVSCPPGNLSKLQLQSAPDFPESLLESRAKNEAFLLSEVEAFPETPNWADSVDASHVTGPGASWANEVPPMTGHTENGSERGNSQPKNDQKQPRSDSAERSKRFSTQHPHRNKEYSLTFHQGDCGDHARNVIRPPYNGMSSNPRPNSYNNRFKGGYRRNNRGSDFHAIPPIPYHMTLPFNGYHSPPYYAPHAGPLRNRPPNHRSFDNPTGHRNFRARSNEQNTS